MYMYELRNTKKITQALFLYEMVIGKNTTLRDLGRKLGMTVQGAANYVQELEKMRYVKNKRVTQKGIEFLHETLSSLQEEVRGIVSNLEMVRSTKAIAEEKFTQGERAYLHMKKGKLYASREKAGAWGIVETPGRAGDLIVVGKLEGIVEIPDGKIWITTSKKIKGMPEYDVLGAFGLDAVHYLEKAGKNIDLKHCVAEASIECALLGMQVLCVVSSELLHVFLKRLQEGMQKYGTVSYEII
jgi:predicted transcriptional regulator